MNKRLMIVVCGLAVIGAGSLAYWATTPALAQERGEKDEEPSTWQKPPKPAPKTTPVQAIDAAINKMGGGAAFQATLEYEDGKWVYGVLVVKGHKISEVVVDSDKGTILDIEGVTPDDEAGEVKEELAAVIKAGS